MTPSASTTNSIASKLQNGTLNRGQLLLNLLTTPQFATIRPGVGPRLTYSLAYLGVLGRQISSRS